MIQDGCIFPCSVCQQTNFPEQVIPVTNLRPGAHQVLLNECLTGYKSLDDIEYICLPCKNAIYRGQVPRLSIRNKCGFPQQPPELLLFPLEERLISPIIPFMNVRERPVGGQKAIYGSICHVPVDVAPTVNSLPHNMQDTETISVKIKRKHSYKHHVLAENIRPRKVLEALHYLLQNSTMFQNENIQIDTDWLRKLLTDESNTPPSTTHDVSQIAATQVTQDQMEMTRSYVTSSSTVDTTDPASMLPVEDEDADDNDDQEEEEDDEPINAPSTNTMLHDKDIDPTSTTLTFAPGEGKRPVFHEPLAEYLCFPTIRNSPAYFETKKKDVMAMVRQLSIPTIFFSLSAADTKWTNLLISLGMLLHNVTYTKSDIENMTWEEKCTLISSHPAACARYFHNHVQKFFKYVLHSPHSSFGHLEDFFYCIEFQHRGSPHVHGLLWIKGAPKFDVNSDLEVCAYIDSIIACTSNVSEEEQPYVQFQKHHHSKTCYKKFRGKKVCRFGAPWPPMTHTVIFATTK